MSQETDIKREELRAQLAAITGQAGAALKGSALLKKPEAPLHGGNSEIMSVEQDNIVLAKHPEMTQNLGADELLSLQALGQALPGVTMKTTAASVAVGTPIKEVENAAPIAAAAPPPRRIFLTGCSGVGKNFLAAQVPGACVIELMDPIYVFLRENFPNAQGSAAEFDALAATIRAWGDGVINEKYPLSIARLLFLQYVNPVWCRFGTQPNFWVDKLIENQNDPGQLIVTRVESSADFKALMSAGFKHYHVVTGTATLATRAQRKNADNRLAHTVDQDVIKKLSNQRQGPRLNVVWNDITPASPRVFTVAQWLQEMNTENSPETGE